MLENAGMFVWGTLELSALFAVALAFIGIPLWLLGAGILRIADVVSKGRAERRASSVDKAAVEGAASEEAAAEPPAPRATRFGRPAKLAVFTLLGDAGLSIAIVGVWLLFFSRTQMPDALAILLTGLVGLASILILVICGLWVAVVADMFIAHRVAGRDTKIAYGIVGVLCALQTLSYFGMAAFSR